MSECIKSNIMGPSEKKNDVWFLYVDDDDGFQQNDKCFHKKD